MKNEKIKIYIINYERYIMSPNIFQEAYSIENSWQFKHCDRNPEFIVYHCPISDKNKMYKYIDILSIKKTLGLFSLITIDNMGILPSCYVGCRL